ncbi:homeobox protein Mix.1-like [Mixophyes fleayi]|uniref:homeobox protein Mix.1-like n=1 Tax=Mixophyes fleayi TaxID=3061075 RepID=UPI003F4DB1E5
MSGYTQDAEDYYPDCYLSSPSEITFNESLDQYLGTSMEPLPPKEIELVHVKEEMMEQTTDDLNVVQTSKKNGNRRKQAAVSSPALLEQIPMSQRRKRTVYNQDQLDILEEFFQTNMYPDIHHRELLAKRLYVPESRIQVWFQNRRGKARREKSRSRNMNVCYPNMRHSVNNTHPSALNPNHSLSVSEQHQMAVPQPQEQSLRNFPQEMFQQPADSMPYPQYSSATHQASPNNYYQSAHSSNQQHLYKNVASIMGTKAVDLSGRNHQMPGQSDCMMDFGKFPPNKTITPDMNVDIPAIPMSTASKGLHNGINYFAGQVLYQRSAMPDDFYKQKSTDSGDRSALSGSGPKKVSPL